MRPWWLTLLHEQQQSGFTDLDGARASVRLPVSDRLINQLIAERLSPEGRLHSVTLRALEHERFSVLIRARPAFLPAWEMRFAVEQQPILPHSPVLTLRFDSSGTAFAAHAVQVFGGLPPWLWVRGDRLDIDLAALARRHGFYSAWDVIRGLRIETVPGRFVVTADAELSSHGTAHGEGSTS
jgi:hypothetical protein